MTTHTFSINVTTANGREAAREALLIAFAGRNPDGYKFKLVAASRAPESNLSKPPPLGVEPQWVWKEHRMRHLMERIAAYYPSVPEPEWLQELSELIGDALDHCGYTPKTN